MTRIDFYLLPVAEPHGKLSFACRLAEKAFREGCQVHVHASDADEAAAMDALLWSFRDTSFVPLVPPTIYTTLPHHHPQPRY